jgi:hypothetical protein
MENDATKRGASPRKDESDIRSGLRMTPIRERKRKGGQLADKFHIDAHTIPDGMSYEWKTVSVYGKEDPSYNVMLRDQGWEPVQAERHSDLVSEGVTGPIIRDGLMLMERPIELTREAQAEDRAAAREVIKVKKQQMTGETPAGTMTREAPNLRNKISTHYEALAIDE